MERVQASLLVSRSLRSVEEKLHAYIVALCGDNGAAVLSRQLPNPLTGHRVEIRLHLDVKDGTGDASEILSLSWMAIPKSASPPFTGTLMAWSLDGHSTWVGIDGTFDSSTDTMSPATDRGLVRGSVVQVAFDILHRFASIVDAREVPERPMLTSGLRRDADSRILHDFFSRPEPELASLLR